ncbi:hypothetical protein RN001_010215 [Aquatica leii]|uniref:Uncharacterized protein n=1 Tax=Aquatica leii TaxID=1421715 RepID=A0AAN7SFY5_9COLE|nr:hypothetical protein RN001_010215 [Aquatica leii]
MPLSNSGNKKKNGFGVIWIPRGSRHKHKKNKYYVRDNYDPRRAMMSGDSPNSHTKDYYDFKEGRSTPPPTTSKDIAIQSSSGGGEAKAEILAASVILEPLKEPCSNHVGVIDSQSNHKNDDEIIAQEDKPLKSEHLTDEGDQKKLNGTIDKLDGNWVPTSDVKKDEEDSDENCAVKCLYYTLQCCECSIM